MKMISVNGIELAFEEIGTGERDPAPGPWAPLRPRHVAAPVRADGAARLASPRARRRRAERPDYVEVLEQLDCPALIVAGDEDAFTTRQDADRMHALLQGSRLRWLSGTGHMPNLERPEAFNAALVDFLRQFEERRTVLVTGTSSS